MTSKTMLEEMFRLQNELNVQIRGENWKEQNLPWHRAIWTECAELIESLNWKWWKNDTIDMKNIQIELVDIWHFGMSLIMQNDQLDTFYKSYEYWSSDTISKEIDYDEVFESIEYIVEQVISDRSFDWLTFLYLCEKFGLPIDKLYNLYVGKQILNSFRNKNGYAEGKYKKVWMGREDNDYMYYFCQAYTGKPEHFSENLQCYLEMEYDENMEHLYKSHHVNYKKGEYNEGIDN